MDFFTVYFSFPGDVIGGGDENKKSLSIPNPIISVSDKGLLSSTGVTGHTMLLITSVDEYGLKQTITVVVEVSKNRIPWSKYQSFRKNYQ